MSYISKGGGEWFRDHIADLDGTLSREDLYRQKIDAPIIQPEYIGGDLETAKPVVEYTGDQGLFIDF